MHSSLLIPFHYQANHQSYFLRLNERADLCLNRSSTFGQWQTDEILLQDCRRFTAAPAPDNTLYVIAFNGKNIVKCLQVQKKGVRNVPFPVKAAPSFFVLAFSPTGDGFFYASNEQDELIAATFREGWHDAQLPAVEEKTIPVSLCVDNKGRVHLLVYSFSSKSITYLCRSQDNWSDPYCLNPSIQLISLPCLYADAEQNLHAAWFSPRDQSTCYRSKLSDGWQKDTYLVVDIYPRLLSFIDQEGRIMLWLTGTGTSRQLYAKQNGDWQQAEFATDFRHPVRQGLPGQSQLNLSDVIPARKFYFKRPVLNIKTDDPPPSPGDEDKQFISAITFLAEERKQLKTQLGKKDVSLREMQQLLECERESFNEKICTLEEALQLLRKKINTCEEESKLLQALAERTKNQLKAQEQERKKEQAELLILRKKATEFVQQEARLLSTVRKLEHNLACKQTVWDKLFSLFQKKQRHD